MVNKVMILGRLGKDPEIRYTQEQKPIVTMSVATSFFSKDRQGEKVEEVEWHRVVCFGRHAEIVRDFVKKGHLIYLEGRIHTNKWKDNQGRNQFITEIICSDIKLLPQNTCKEEKEAYYPSAQPIKKTSDDEIDPPF